MTTDDKKYIAKIIRDETVCGMMEATVAFETLMNYPHLKEGVSSFNEAACLKVSLNVEVASPEA